MNSKNLILVVNRSKKILNQTIQTITDYSEKIGSDLEIIEIKNNWEKTNVFDLYTKYNRILILNENIIIRKDTPNLFEVVPETELGVINEGKYTLRVDKIKMASSEFGVELKKWDGKFYNDGVIVTSRIHKKLFKKPNFLGSDFCSYFNLLIAKEETKICELNPRYNRMHFMDDKIGITRHDSYIIHYQDAPDDIIEQNINQDLNKWEKDFPNYNYKRNFLISVSAGMGDQLCAEPAIRSTIDLYPDDNFHMVTHFPRLFEHLNVPCYQYDDFNGLEDCCIKLYSCPEEADSEHHLSHVFFHPTDFASMSMIKKTIPNHDKTIQLKLKPEETKSVLDLLKDRNQEKEVIVVHAGKWWPSKTFPIEWWQEVVDKLSEKLTVVLIGKTIDEKQGYQPIDCPKDGIDLRDNTTLGELFSLISLSKVLLSNDSSPIHMAGAFDNWIVTIPTCKHADHILPFRNGTQYYKTKTLNKKLMLDDLETRHTESNVHTIDQIPEGKSIYDYLPEIDDLVKEVFEIYENEN